VRRFMRSRDLQGRRPKENCEWREGNIREGNRFFSFNFFVTSPSTFVDFEV
jgi:hypothetical protein